MSQSDYIKNIARYGLQNDQEKLLGVLNELIEHSKKTKKLNFALQLQSLLRDAINKPAANNLTKVGSDAYFDRMNDKEVGDLIIEKLTSDYKFSDLVASEPVRNEIMHFIDEHNASEMLQRFELPISNKILLYGPSGCGKTLASYVIAGELNKMMIVVNLGAIVSSRLGETSKNLAKLFRNAAAEDCIIFIDEFDSLGKVRDYNQDHGEMKRVVNTILQLFDYLPQSSIVIAATNQADMLDDALLRRFDAKVKFELPGLAQIQELVKLTLKNGRFSFDKPTLLKKILNSALGLSYYAVQKTLVTATKRSLFSNEKNAKAVHAKISTGIWQELIKEEQKSSSK